MQGFSMNELSETRIQAEANYHVDMGRYVPPEHEGVTSANKLAGKYGYIQSLSPEFTYWF